MKDGLHDLQQLSIDLDCAIVTVDYRLAPEVRFTGSVEDNYAALRWMYANAADMWHGFTEDFELPEAKEARRVIVRFWNRHLRR